MPPAAATRPSARHRATVLGCPVDVVDLPEAVDRIVGMVEEARANPDFAPGVVVTLNPEMVMHARRDPGFRATIERAALIIPDGIGIVHALRRRGESVERVAGADLLDAYVERASALGHRIALVGAGPGVAAAAAARYRERFPNVQIVFAEGADPTLLTVERLRDARPDVVGAAYGHGRQERFLDEHLTAIGAACGIGIGGSLDYVAGVISRAPQIVRRLNMEWGWRLARQPRRIRRQLVLPLFWWRQRREAP